MNEYKEIIETLKPKCDIKASAGLRASIRKSANYTKRRNKRHNVLYGLSIAGAAAVTLILLMPTGISAKEILSSALESLKSQTSITIDFEIRTKPTENFSYIDLSSPFIAHKLEAVHCDSVCYWRIDKGGRIACGSESENYVWIPDLKIGRHFQNEPPKSVLSELSIFLSPEKIIEAELQQVINHNDNEYSISRNDKGICLTVHALPEGDFNNPYMLNKSISESETIRRYVFDNRTKALKSASITVSDNGKQTEVLRITNIGYNIGTDKNLCQLPDDIKFIEYCNAPAIGGFLSLPPEDVAQKILGAFAEWDESVINQTIEPDMSAIYKPDYKGAELISIGKSFHSGAKENRIFIPYTMRMPDGHIKRHNIALLKQEDGSWIVSGGL